MLHSIVLIIIAAICSALNNSQDLNVFVYDNDGNFITSAPLINNNLNFNQTLKESSESFESDELTNKTSLSSGETSLSSSETSLMSDEVNEFNETNLFNETNQFNAMNQFNDTNVLNNASVLNKANDPTRSQSEYWSELSAKQLAHVLDILVDCPDDAETCKIVFTIPNPKFNAPSRRQATTRQPTTRQPTRRPTTRQPTKRPTTRQPTVMGRRRLF